MAASDKPFRDQRTLDIVFAVSNILLLLSTFWMLWQDYHREYKVEQRLFRDVEVAMAQRAALNSIPSEDEFAAAEKNVIEKKKNRDDRQSELANAQAAMISYQPAKERTEAAFQEIKADVESFTSLLNIAIEHGNESERQKYVDLLADRNAKLADAAVKRDDVVAKMKLEQLKIDEIDGAYNKAVAEFKKVNDRFDTQVKLASAKNWTMSDSFRTWFLVEAYAPNLKIHQFTIDDIPIDYNFRKVTRFDRCMSCHVGIDRPAFTRANLESLTNQGDYDAKIKDAIELHKRRVKALDPRDADAVPDPANLNPRVLSKDKLTASRITEFAAHPRLDLFVGSSSKHPSEKFGCTSCHAGQGSGTSFGDSSHSPNSHASRETWTKDRGWEHNHMWDFPMLPSRFVESSCIKCHHEVTDLIGSDSRLEAPKVLRGHGLIKEYGCFGCHEISGWKGAARVGPDLRLEPSPALEDLTHTERNRAINDPDNRPGSMRKVGPSLARMTEKLSPAFVEKWIRSPSSFRPDTKMPHYYGLTNNDESKLPKEQEAFPNAEIVSITHFLNETSKRYLSDADKQRQSDAKDARAVQADNDLLQSLLNKGRLSESDQKDLTAVKRRIKLRKETPLTDLAPGYTGKADSGRTLFIERGCLSCHVHHATEKKEGNSPEVISEAVFGPNLSQISAKFDKSEGTRKWLVQWITNPHVHSPRSRMPITHLTPTEAADIAAWLMDQDASKAVGSDWENLTVKSPERADLEALAKVYLTRMLSKEDMNRFFQGIPRDEAERLREKKSLKDNSLTLMVNDITDDEKQLLIDDVKNNDSLKFYLGKKAVNRLGCFACHDIPGFESTKSIGVGLNDWGKKAPDRLAFEDIKNFFDKHYYTVDSLDDVGKPKDMGSKEPYEAFYREALIGHFPDRIGYLNQKIRDPRSYDYNRIRAWDDRSRMPKFTLARPRKKENEDDKVFKGRVFKEEAEAREAVATFVLGLVAEQVPAKSIHQPTGDRLAEIKGRQILDKYNCNGCHLIRPGTYDFKLGPETLRLLEERHAGVEGTMQEAGELIPLNHSHWIGRNPLGGDRLTLSGTRPLVSYDEETKLDTAFLRLSEAFRFIGKDKTIKNIPAGANAEFALPDVLSYPTPIKNQEQFNRHFQTRASYGGAFSDIMVPYLTKKDEKKYPFIPATQDSPEARASLPPSLIAQGERTQPEWLYEFLLNPTKIRRMAILRMPKFNMSKAEAEILRDYFTAVSRQNNPGIGLTYASDIIQQRQDLSGDFWKAKTAAYIARLKQIPGEKDKKTTLYEDRIAAYTPLWQQIKEKQSPELKAEMDKLREDRKSLEKEKDEKQKKADGLKDEKEKAKLKTEIDSLVQLLAANDEASKQTQGAFDRLDVKVQQETWEKQEAYATDAYRLLMSRELCTKCHQIGSTVAAEQNNQGPPLDLAHGRLRPEWIERWVNQPNRYLPYNSLMPPYFNRNKTQYQNIHAGIAEEQIQAVRDALISYPRLSNLPANKMYNPDKK